MDSAFPSETGSQAVPAVDPLFNLSLAKGLAALSAFDAGHRFLTLGELAEQTGMSKASAQRTMHTLQVLGYVGKHPQTRRFHLKPKVMELGFNYLAAHPLIQVAHPYLAQLAEASGESASLTEAVDLDMVYVSQLMTSKFIPMLTPVGMRIPMYCSSSGRAYLSRLPDEQVRQLLEHSQRVARTPSTLTDVESIMAQIAECRRLGYAVNCEELFLGDMGVAAAVSDSRGRVLGSVHVSPPASRWTVEEARRKLGPLVIECALAISRVVSS